MLARGSYSVQLVSHLTALVHEGWDLPGLFVNDTVSASCFGLTVPFRRRLCC